MQLAEAMGVPVVNDLLDAIEPEEFTEWMAKDELEPLGQRRLRDQLAVMASGLFNAAVHGETTATDFSLDERPEERIQTPEEQRAICETIAAAAGAQ